MGMDCSGHIIVRNKSVHDNQKGAGENEDGDLRKSGGKWREAFSQDKLMERVPLQSADAGQPHN